MHLQKHVEQQRAALPMPAILSITTIVSLHKANKGGLNVIVFDKEGHKQLESLLTETVPCLEGAFASYSKQSCSALKKPTPELWLSIAQYQTSHS